MISWLKQKLYQEYVSRKYKVLFLKDVIINRGTRFEGYNAAYRNVKLNDTYIGLGTYIANNSVLRRTNIGRFCAIGENVRTGLGLHPVHDFVSIHPAFFSLGKQAGFTFVKEQLFEEHKYVDDQKSYFVKIGSDVWIGNNVMIMDGITVGDGAVIAAGSIVTKNIEPFAIVGGIPAKHIKYRFEEKDRQLLLSNPWWENSIDWLERNSSRFADINMFLSSIERDNKIRK